MQELRTELRESGLVKEDDLRSFKLGLYELWEDSLDELDKDIELDEHQFIQGVLRNRDVSLNHLWCCVTAVRMQLRACADSVNDRIDRLQDAHRAEVDNMRDACMGVQGAADKAIEARLSAGGSTHATLVQALEGMRSALDARGAEVAATRAAGETALARVAELERSLAIARLESEQLRGAGLTPETVGKAAGG